MFWILPLSEVDYSGGVIISDWYTDNTNKNQALKITVRFLSNTVQTNSLKVTVHRKSVQLINLVMSNYLSPEYKRSSWNYLRNARYFRKTKRNKILIIWKDSIFKQLKKWQSFLKNKNFITIKAQKILLPRNVSLSIWQNSYGSCKKLYYW